jgi:anti-sigma28 factor (negative regulator of flagellin synthesis)
MPIDGIVGRTAPELIAFRVDDGQKDSTYYKPISVAKSQGQHDFGFSEMTKRFVEIRKLVDSLPDVRLDRVNQLAKAIDEGTYDVKGHEIADAIIRKNLIDFED